MLTEHDIDQMDGNTSINESKELNENQNKCDYIEAETRYSELTGKIAGHIRKTNLQLLCQQ